MVKANLLKVITIVTFGTPGEEKAGTLTEYDVSAIVTVPKAVPPFSKGKTGVGVKAA